MEQVWPCGCEYRSTDELLVCTRHRTAFLTRLYSETLNQDVPLPDIDWSNAEARRLLRVTGTNIATQPDDREDCKPTLP